MKKHITPDDVEGIIRKEIEVAMASLSPRERMMLEIMGKPLLPDIEDMFTWIVDAHVSRDRNETSDLLEKNLESQPAPTEGKKVHEYLAELVNWFVDLWNEAHPDAE